MCGIAGAGGTARLDRVPAGSRSRALFYVGVIGLALFELAKVYFIMPMPGSQRLATVEIAYAFYQWRWWVRGACALLILLARLRLPEYASMVTYGNLAFAFLMVVVIAAVSSYIGVRKVLRIEPFDIFRG